MSSLSFLGNTTSYLAIPNTNEFDFGTGDFTIEWYQYQTDSNPYPRIFQIGNATNNGTTIGVSIEGRTDGTFYYWTNGIANPITILSSSSYRNKWVHFAISRNTGVTKIFMNGNSIYSMNDTNNFNGVDNLIISNESTVSNDAAFGGYIAYFSWVKGVSLYNANFTVSNTYPSLTNNYVLLLKASSFTGTLGNTVINNNVSVTPNVPPNFLVNISNSINPKSLFTNNSLVFYKKGSLASCGVGSVRNSSIKSHRI